MGILRGQFGRAVHFDLCPTGGDQQAEVERLLSLGARRVDIGRAT
jgi:hypothetical protein